MSSTIRQNPVSCPGHTRPVVDLQFTDMTEHGYYFITASKDGKPMLRRGHTGDWIGTFEGHKGATWCCTLTPDGNRAATGAADFVAKVWNAETGAEMANLAHDHIVRTVDFCRTGGDKLLTSTNKKIVRIFDLNAPDNGAVTSLSGHTGTIKRALWIDNDRRVITISEDKTMKIWDLSNGEEIKSVTFDDIPMDLQLNQETRKAILSCGTSVSLWTLDGPLVEKNSEFRVTSPMFSACLHPFAFSGESDPSTDVFVCGGNDFVIYKYNAITGAEIESSKGHFGPVHVIRFSPDGKLYASGSEDGTVRLWQTLPGETYGLWKLVQPGEE